MKINIHIKLTFIVLPFLFIVVMSGFSVVNAQLTYPGHFTYEGNPLVRTHGAADPDAHVWDNTVWVYCSQDHEGGYSNMDGYHAFSSSDLINWIDHGDVFNSTMLDENLWGKTPEHWMWAPGAARKKNENGEWTYFLYYPHNVKFDGQDWVTGVATAPTPAGPFTDQGPLRNGEVGMDPMVFIDDDGEAYIYSNTLLVAKLKPDMLTLAESPRKLQYAPDSVTNEQNLRFGEGSYMHKKDGIYYFSYSNFHNHDYQSFYATGDNPYGPFEWQGPMAPNPQGAQDHHSLIELKNQWYYFYHIAIPNIPALKDGQSRITCYDRLYYNQDGTIQLVVHTRGPKNVISMDVPHGIIQLDPPGGAYNKNTEITLTVLSDLGYAFDSWGGDLSGGENPTSLTMDADKTVIANFVSTPTYRLNTNAVNGSVSLEPPGGEYNAGTVVTIKTTDDFGYDFGSWSGDLSGSQNPGLITMDSDKQVDANFIKVSTYSLTTDASNGTFEVHPPRGIYEKRTEVTITAIRDYGFEFNSWSGDFSGTENPITIIMDSNKKLTANYDSVGGAVVVFAVNCGGDEYKSAEGVNYSKDKWYSGGGTYSGGGNISLTEDDFLYKTERFGNVTYNIPLPNGEYEVVLMFAEIFHSSPGSRLFDVFIENEKVISNLDIVSEVGNNAAYTEKHKVSVDGNNLTIKLNTIKGNAKISAIQIIKPEIYRLKY